MSEARRVMEITTNVGCRNMCVYCPQTANISAYAGRRHVSGSGEGGRMMSLATFKTCIDKMPATTAVFFAGSAEPWLNPACTPMLEYAYERGHPVRVYTTLVGMTEADIAVLTGMKLERVVIHLPSEGDRERYRADEKYMALLEIIQKANLPNIDFMSVGTVQPVVHTILTAQVRQTQYDNMSDFGGNLKGDLAPHRTIAGPIYCVGNRLYWNVLYPNGDVALCCEDFGLKHVIGNLLESEYDELYTSDEFKRVQRGLSDDTIDTLCRRCEYARPQLQIASSPLRAQLTSIRDKVKRRLERLA